MIIAISTNDHLKILAELITSTVIGDPSKFFKQHSKLLKRSSSSRTSSRSQRSHHQYMTLLGI